MSFDYFPYYRFFYSTLCHVCKHYGPHIKRCSTCKTVSYCSKEHQKHDWKLHKDLCRAMAKADNDLKDFSVNNFDEFKQYNVKRSFICHQVIGRPLLDSETQMWMFPKTCAVCYSRDTEIDCPSCLSVSYCSQVHQNIHKKEHSRYCGALKLSLDINLYCFHKKFKPMDLLLKEFDADVETLPASLRELMIMYDKGNQQNTNSIDDLIHFIIQSDLVAPSATILYGLEKSGMLKDRVLEKPKINIHIVGANLTELGWLWRVVSELAFHWIRNLQCLNFCVIGPELKFDGITEYLEQDFCDICKTKNPISKIIFHPHLYLDIIENLEEPDLVVSFNSGIHEIGEDNEWHESIDCLTKYSSVPLVLTAYTEEEIELDVNAVKVESSHEVDVVLEPQKNPFANMTPIRDWGTEGSPVFYMNGYISILKAAR